MSTTHTSVTTATVSIMHRWTDHFLSSLFRFITTAMTGTPTSTFPADYLFLQQRQQQLTAPHRHQIDTTTSNVTTTTSSSSLSPIPFPDWEYEIWKLQLYLIVASILWFIVVPYCYSYYCYYVGRRRNRKVVVPTTTTGSTSSKNDKTTTEQQPEKGKRLNIQSLFYDYLIRLPMTIGMIFLGWIITVLLILTLVSPYNNSYTARRIFQTPLLTNTECQDIIQMSHEAAMKNVQNYQRYHPDDFSEEEELMLYEVPYGWQKLRHAKVPTTDLNLITDPFTYEQQQYIVQRLGQVRMAPLLSRLYGVPIRSIQARDIFIVRYDGNSTSRYKLKKHTDGGDISFTIYLNTDFTGGGTRFWNRHTKQPFYLMAGGNGDGTIDERSNTDTGTVTGTTDLVQPGQFSAFPSIIEHEGYPTTEGIRYILVGFLDVVRYDEDGITPSGLSIYASYLNWNWMLASISTAVEKWDWDVQQYYYDPKLLRKYVTKVVVKVALLLDRYTEHCITMPLIQQEQLPELIEVLEQSFQNSTINTTTGGSSTAVKSRISQRARWIEGQQKKAFVRYINDYFYVESEEDDNDGIVTVAAEDQPVEAPATMTTNGIHPPDV